MSKLERQDRDRRQKEIQNLPVNTILNIFKKKKIFILLFRKVYLFLHGVVKKNVKKNNDKWKQHLNKLIKTIIENVSLNRTQTLISSFFYLIEPIPIVLMNEDDIPEEGEEDAASDRTLVAENEEENPSPEYRMTTITPSANTIPLADEIHDDDEEATLADPTIMTLQTPLPEQPIVQKQQQQQNMHRLMEKIDRQRKAAQNRTNQQTALVTPTIKTPKKLVVSPAYAESGSSTDSSLTQQNLPDEQSSSNTTTAEIEERRIQLE